MFLYGFSSCTCLYKWLSILVWVFVTYMFVRMTIHIIVYGFSSMHISVQMTIHFFLMGFRHVHVSTNDYPYSYGFSSRTCCTNDYPYYCVWLFVMNISVRMTIHLFWMRFCHVHVCTNDYHFLVYGFASCTFLY